MLISLSSLSKVYCWGSYGLPGKIKAVSQEENPEEKCLRCPWWRVSYLESSPNYCCQTTAWGREGNNLYLLAPSSVNLGHHCDYLLERETESSVNALKSSLAISPAQSWRGCWTIYWVVCLEESQDRMENEWFSGQDGNLGTVHKLSLWPSAHHLVFLCIIIPCVKLG